MKTSATCSVALALVTVPLSAVTLTDSFTGDTLDSSIWFTTPFVENQGTLTPVNDRLEFTAGPGSSLFDSNHYASYSAFGLVNGFSDWSAQVTANLAPVADFGTFGTNDAVILTFGLENSNDTSDNIELTFSAGDPLGTGAGKTFRDALKTDDVSSENFTNFLSDVGALDLKMSYSTVTGEVSISFDDDGTEVSLGSYDISAWDLGTDQAFNIFVTGGAINTAQTVSTTTFEVTSGEAYFDDLIVNTDTSSVPEPTVSVLAAFGALALLRRRR